MFPTSAVLLLLRPVSSLPSAESRCLWPLPSASLLSSRTRGRTPKSARQVHRGPILWTRGPSPLGGTLPADPATPRSCGQRGAFCSRAGRPGRGAPALIRLITVHMAAARARPPLSHGREESPSVRLQNRGRFSRRPAPRRRPLAAASSSRPVPWLSPPVVRAWLPDCVSLVLSPAPPPSSLCLPFCAPLPVPSEDFWLSLCSLYLPHSRVQHAGSPWVHSG